jgi:hypothetical protein
LYPAVASAETSEAVPTSRIIGSTVNVMLGVIVTSAISGAVSYFAASSPTNAYQAVWKAGVQKRGIHDI